MWAKKKVPQVRSRLGLARCAALCNVIYVGTRRRGALRSVSDRTANTAWHSSRSFVTRPSASQAGRQGTGKRAGLSVRLSRRAVCVV